MDKNSKIYISGHNGMVGSSILRLLKDKGYTNIIARSSKELDLRNQSEVNDFFEIEKPEFVFLAAAKVGGIHANNKYKADFIYDNIMIQSNIINASKENNTKKLLFLGSSCIYPKFSKQPIEESELLTGLLEPTNEPYAIAKIAGIKMCEAYRDQYSCNFISAMPTNLYGTNDNYDLNNSHVLPAMLRKFHEAKVNNIPSVHLWGSGSPMREFLHVEDLADASLYLMENYNEGGWINIGTGEDITIKDLALTIKNIVDYKGEIEWDSSKPDGTPKKQLNTAKINAFGWNARIDLHEGILKTYIDFKNNYERYAK